jgi:hypothetical protein
MMPPNDVSRGRERPLAGLVVAMASGSPCGERGRYTVSCGLNRSRIFASSQETSPPVAFRQDAPRGREKNRELPSGVANGSHPHRDGRRRRRNASVSTACAISAACAPKQQTVKYSPGLSIRSARAVVL